MPRLKPYVKAGEGEFLVAKGQLVIFYSLLVTVLLLAFGSWLKFEDRTEGEIYIIQRLIY